MKKRTTPVTMATKRIIAAIQDGEPRAFYQPHIDVIESESKQLLVDIMQGGR